MASGLPKHQMFRRPEVIMNRNLSLFVSLLTMAALSACGGGGGTKCDSCNAPQGPVTSMVTGTILDKAGAPVSGVAVSVYHHNDHTTLATTTDSLGKYSVAGVTTGNNTDYVIYAEKSGFGFYPAVSDPAAGITKFDFNGLYRTVIRYLSVPAHNVAANNFTAFRAGDQAANLPRTGQTTTYAMGDDASMQKGVAWPATRFTDNLNGTVTDHLTGLVWLRDADCKGATDWPTAITNANQLASGQCGLSDGSAAGQWRMPNANELESLVDVSQFGPSVSAGHPFSNINLLNAYWSSTTYAALNLNAMAIRFSDGRWINGIDAGDQSFNNIKATSHNALWAVKSGGSGAIQLLATGVYAGIGGTVSVAGDDATLQLGVPLNSPRFIDKGDGTLADTVTGLTWLKMGNCISGNWASALSAVNGLASGQCGLTDGSTPGQWRMPNRAEMLSLSDRAPTFPQADYFNGQAQGSTGPVTGPVVFNNFVVSKFYWTSTTDAADAAQAWTVYSCDFGVYNQLKTDAIEYALAVR
jgi:hypothetical protein